jgi:hypothetical protein
MQTYSASKYEMEFHGINTSKVSILTLKVLDYGWIYTIYIYMYITWLMRDILSQLFSMGSSHWERGMQF